jgi:hypothetical protein
MVQLDDVNGQRVARTQAAWPAEADRALPSRRQAALFVGKAWCFRPPVDRQLEVTLDRDKLTVALRALGAAAATPPGTVPELRPPEVDSGEATGSCDSCSMTRCFRNEPAPARLPATGDAWLVDAWWPEYDDAAIPLTGAATPIRLAGLAKTSPISVRTGHAMPAGKTNPFRQVALAGSDSGRSLAEQYEFIVLHKA